MQNGIYTAAAIKVYNIIRSAYGSFLGRNEDIISDIIVTEANMTEYVTAPRNVFPMIIAGARDIPAANMGLRKNSPSENDGFLVFAVIFTASCHSYGLIYVIGILSENVLYSFSAAGKLRKLACEPAERGGEYYRIDNGIFKL